MIEESKPKTKKYTFTFEIRDYYQIKVEDTDEAEAYDKAVKMMSENYKEHWIDSGEIDLQDTYIEVLDDD